MAKERPGQMRYPSELKERATKMVLDLRAQDLNDVNVISRVARQLGVGSESLRTWVKRAAAETGNRTALTTKEREELKRLRKENREHRRANDILQAAAVFFEAELDRRQKTSLHPLTATAITSPAGVSGHSSKFVPSDRSPPPPTTTERAQRHRTERSVTRSWDPSSRRSSRRTTPFTASAS